MAGVCGDNRFEIIAKVKERLLKATNIKMHPEELAQVDNILFRLWQLNYFNQCNGRENKIKLIKTKKKLDEATEIIYRLMDIINHDLKCFDTMAGLDVKQKAMEFLKEQE